ncbi:reverse transcriptase family protein [Parasediminibacterium sp. JCM 36343]|uniref:reverse transcriptase family protein n=1 Tax=Parasediminibacterium sp. JCM 36343 TaxID=3374279 RepID=UPI00397B933E
MNSSQSKTEAYKNYEFKKLCHIIGFNESEINPLLDSIESNYKEWSETKLDKAGNAKTYLDGTIKTRTFRNPSQLLKVVQKRIQRNIIDIVSLPDNVHGGVKGKSNITNAKAHQGNKYLFETDLQEFYPNIKMRRVHKIFKNLGYSEHIAHWLTKLTTRKNEVPQGSPTSTGISNLVFLETDYKLIEICKKNNIKYTRYIDDLTFSSQQDFGHLISEILEIVIGGDFKISRRKTKYSGGQTITGVHVFLNKIDAPKKIIDKAHLEKESNTVMKPYTNYLNSIRKTNK